MEIILKLIAEFFDYVFGMWQAILYYYLSYQTLMYGPEMRSFFTWTAFLLFLFCFVTGSLCVFGSAIVRYINARFFGGRYIYKG